jgi:alkanesulfonate monooxygenase SsuD/methylene tetrahydromethanopterin reductase-like flavin-dependent oxidoreductase (luciferase family)
VHIGVCYFPTDYGIDIRELARADEERGFESLFLPEHTHIPKSRRTPYPGGGELPKAYSHTHDLFVALSFAAAATTKILLGTGVCLIPQRDPIVTAKCVASLDQISCPGVDFFSASVAVGMSMRWKITERAMTPASS